MKAHTFRIASFLLLSLLPTAAVIQADDWPQWMGPNRDDVWSETGIIEKFPSDGPKILWRTKADLGYSGPAVVGRQVFVFDYVPASGEVKNDPGTRATLQGKERLRALTADSGEELWSYDYDCPYSISYPSGPRCTPTVADGKVYALGAEGNLSCVAATDGKLIWSKDFKKDYNAKAPIWGFCSHPLVDGENVYCVVGGPGSVAVAFNKDTGEEAWKALTASEQGYAPPSIIESNGVRQLLIWDADKLSSLNLETGKVYWSQPLKPSYGMAIMAPRKSGDYLFASAIGNVAALMKLSPGKPGVEVVWTGKPKTALYAANATPLIDGETLYGPDCQTGSLMAVDLKTSDRLWTTQQPLSKTPAARGDRPISHGTEFLVKNGDRYFLFTETGDLVIASLTREKYEEIDRAHILEPTGEAFGRPVVWSHPAFANKRCYARNDKEIVCVDLAE